MEGGLPSVGGFLVSGMTKNQELISHVQGASKNFVIKNSQSFCAMVGYDGSLLCFVAAPDGS
jgi:hypothetical protein